MRSPRRTSPPALPAMLLKRMTLIMKDKARLRGTFYLVRARSNRVQITAQELMSFKGRAKMVRARNRFTVELRTLPAAMRLLARCLGKVATVAMIEEVPRSAAAPVGKKGPLLSLKVAHVAAERHGEVD